MAYTYAQLRDQYRKRLAAGRGGEQFLKDHPNFAKAYAAAQAKKKPAPTPTPTPGTTPPATETPTGAKPDRPSARLPEGWTWEWNNESGEWEATQADREGQDDLMAMISSVLDQYGLKTPGLLSLADRALTEGWSILRFKNELRKHDDYLANPLFAANMQRAKQKGGMFLSEEQVLADAEARRTMAKMFGYAVPSDTDLAKDVAAGRSVAEFEHRLKIQKDVDTYGAGVKRVMAEHGYKLDDATLRDLFDPEVDTEGLTNAYKNAIYRGRPFALGLGVRSQAEADRLIALGVDPNEAFSRYESVAANASRFDRLATIEGEITADLPDDFGGHLSKASNSLLVQGLVFNDPRALAELQSMTARELARFKTGGGAVGSQGQAVGLLSQKERASFG